MRDKRAERLVWAGVALFWLACVESARLPVWSLFVGPAVIVAGVAGSWIGRQTGDDSVRRPSL